MEKLMNKPKMYYLNKVYEIKNGTAIEYDIFMYCLVRARR